jgi:hypothetical protein
MRFRIHFQPSEPPPKPEPKPEPQPETDVLEQEERETPEPTVAFEPSAPPARPVDAELSGLAVPADSTIVKSDERAIRALLKEYYRSRKPSNLLFRCRLCRGKGSQRDGTPCEHCAGAGSRINLYHFRKAFWGVYTPALRDAPGALSALRAFYERAQADPAALAPLVRSFKVRKLEHKGYWARVTVEENTAEGRRERRIALIGTGRSWYFYNPATDGELIPVGGT